MKRIKLFEEFNSEKLSEGMMSEIDIIGQESETREDFLTDLKKFLSVHAANPDVANNADFLNGMADTYFDENGKKLETVN
jgi:hypothetical protein